MPRRPALIALALVLLSATASSLVLTCKSSSSDAPGNASADASSSGGESGALGTPPEDPTDTTTPRVRYVGRVDSGDAAGPKLAWGGTRIIARFRGTGMRVKISEHNISDGPSGYDVIIDNALQSNPFVPTDGQNDYDVASSLAADTEHVVELYRRTEPMVAITQILGVTFPNGGQLLAPPAFPNRRIEILGDSESTGYGVECASTTEAFSGLTENEHKAYPAIVGTLLAADIHNISYSGKGISRNEDANSQGFAADFYVQSIAATAAPNWDFNLWRPDVVWIALGGNDWDIGLTGDRPPPDPAVVKAKYTSLVDLVRAKNPDAQIVCAVQGMLNDNYPPNYMAYTNAKTVFKQVVDEHNAAGDAKVQYAEHPRAQDEDLTGCDSHPNAAYHQKAAAVVAAKIGAIMGWQ